jgi:hypothetical protein
MAVVFGTLIVFALVGAVVCFIGALWGSSGRLAHKGIAAMDAAVQINQRMAQRPLPPPTPGSKVG